MTMMKDARGEEFRASETRLAAKVPCPLLTVTKLPSPASQAPAPAALPRSPAAIALPPLSAMHSRPSTSSASLRVEGHREGTLPTQHSTCHNHHSTMHHLSLTSHHPRPSSSHPRLPRLARTPPRPCTPSWGPPWGRCPGSAARATCSPAASRLPPTPAHQVVIHIAVRVEGRARVRLIGRRARHRRQQVRHLQRAAVQMPANTMAQSW